MFICPVCGYDKLEEIPYDEDGNPSHEICLCCGFEFGYDDFSEGISIDNYRKKWLDEGAPWFELEARPLNWNLKRQLEKIGVFINP